MTLLGRATRFVAALTLAGAATIGALSQPAQAAPAAPTHVAIVVDFGAGNVRTSCVPSGGNGSAVLGAGFQVTYNKTGLVVKINGVGNLNPPLSLYWSYWHSSGGSWSYASTGPATYHPAPGTVEGWAYNDGSVGPGASPSYAAICGQDPAPPPAPTPPHPVTHAPSTHRATSGPAGQPGQPGSATSGGGAQASASTPAAGDHAASSAKRTSSRARTTASSGANQASDSSHASQPAVQLVGAKQSGKHRSAAPAFGTALALLAVVGLGGAAFWRLRRQRLG